MAVDMFEVIKMRLRTYRLRKVTSEALGTLPEVQRILSLEDYLGPYSAESRGLAEASSLDMGCGGQPKNPFGAKHLFGLDIRENSERGIRYADLTVEPIPFSDESFDYITAYDFIEHVPRVIYMPTRRFPFVQLMNEVWRTLKPGGIFLSHTPTYPYSSARTPHDAFHTINVDHEFTYSSVTR